MPRRYISPDELTEPEAAVQEDQGKTIGPTVDDEPVRQMSQTELRDMLLRLTVKGEGSRRKVWFERQAAKVRRELKRRRYGSRAD